MIVYGFSFALPFLLVLAALLALTGPPRSRWGAGATLAGAALAVSVPLAGLPVARWLFSVNANFSIPLTALIADTCWRRLAGRKLLNAPARRAAWFFGLVCAVVLYPMALGVGPLDPYTLGWRSPALLVALWALTVILLWSGNRFGLVMAAAILAYDLRLLESRNLWDYLVDPAYGIASVVAVISHLVHRPWRRGSVEGSLKTA